MLHAMRFEGGYERNFRTLQRNATQYVGENGATCDMAPWPASAAGLRYGFMEQPGKRFVVVRVRYGEDEVLLHHPVRIDPSRHLGGKRFSAEPITLADGPAGALLGDVIDANRDQQAELTALRDHVRETLQASKPR